MNLAPLFRRLVKGADVKDKPTLAERFAAKVPEASPDDCWEWNGWRKGGYGKITLNGRDVSAHRVAWELAHGPIPEGLQVLHSCDNPPCVNPAHLWLGTNADNVADKMAKGRQNPARGLRHGRHTKPWRNPRGEGHGMAKVTTAQVLAMRERYAAGETQRALAAEYGLTSAVVSKIINRVIWAHV